MRSKEVEIPWRQLSARSDPSSLGFETTAEVPPITAITGQDRALRALEFGLEVRDDGYHVYVAGPEGTGKMTALTSVLDRIKVNQETPPDWCYVQNFDDPNQPRVVSLPAGLGARFVKQMDDFLEQAKEAIPRAFESEDYARRKAKAVQSFEEKRDELSKSLAEDARKQGFAIEATQMGMVTVPLADGKPMTKEDFDALPPEQQQSLQKTGEHVKEELERVLRQGHLLEQEARARVEELDREIAKIAVGPFLDDLVEDYRDLPDVVDHLEKIRNDIPEHLGDFRHGKGESREEVLEALLREDHLVRYRVNLLVDNAHTKGAPVVIEHRPTYYNLFGRVDYKPRLGSMVTDFTMIKPGSVHCANGGYLVLQARDALTGLLVWDTLKHTIRSGEARIENLGEQYSAVPTASIRPQPIPLKLKVVLVGPLVLYHMLSALDEDFRRLFGVRSDFDVDLARTPEHISQYAAFISSMVTCERLKPFHKSAIARLVDYASRMAEHQERLSTRLVGIARLAREANFWASKAGKEVVGAEDVEKAAAEREYRLSMMEDRFRRYVLEDTVRIATDGSAVAQVNGLSVIDVGEHAFGRPARITAQTSPGTRGVVDIERETQMSGRIHSKGVLILGGYLAGKYAQDKPLTLSGTLTFEQTYDEVEGDSASSAELYALLSSLSGLAIKQAMAVTGSVNQQGAIQAIGGVNEKIEGFFRLCKERGLSGEQGVIIPRDNVKHLMLKDEVVQATAEGRFHVWAVSTVEEGIELLTGIAAGRKRSDGTYAEGTLNFLVDQRLKTFAERLKEFRPLEQPQPERLKEREVGVPQRGRVRRRPAA